MMLVVFEYNVRVNNTVIDKELGGKDVAVWLSWRKIWNGLKKGEFSPSKRLEADLAEMYTVRWFPAYFRGVEGGWTIFLRA